LFMKKNLKAVSTLVAILLILVAAILGGLISYMWAISPFYATPTNVGLTVTSVDFQVNHADYFDVTVLNPSYSLGGTNIASVFIEVQGEGNVFNVTDTSPSLPVFVDQGAATTLRCYFSWGSYSGKNMTVTVFPQTGVGGSFPVQTQFVGLTSNTFFNANESIEYFTMIVQNDQLSAINLTLTSVSLDSEDVTHNVHVIGQNQTLPVPLNIGESTALQCVKDWQGHSSPDVVIGTQEGYKVESKQNVSASALLQVSDVQFNESNPDRIIVTLNSSSESMTSVTVSNITIAYGNTSNVINGTLSSPALPCPLGINSSLTLDCEWNWSDISYRNMTISVTANTTQGFVSLTSTFTTPLEAYARINQARFDQNDTGDFYVDTANLLYSLQAINVTGVSFNGVAVSMTPQVINAGEQASILCTYNWSSFVGQTVSIVAHLTYGSNSSLTATFQVTVPVFMVVNLSFGTSEVGTPYMNVTVRTSEFSSTSENITRISVLTANTTQLIDGTLCFPAITPGGYQLAAGTEATIVCPLSWNQYSGSNVTVTVQTAEGFQASKTSIVQ
jgi:hypothetical protein